jgi:hypothetical protein
MVWSAIRAYARLEDKILRNYDQLFESGDKYIVSIAGSPEKFQELLNAAIDNLYKLHSFTESGDDDNIFYTAVMVKE